MLILLLVLFTFVAIVVGEFASRFESEECGAFACFLVVVCIILLIPVLINAHTLTQAPIIDDVIKIHQEENRRIEESLMELVTMHMEHEQHVFENVNHDSIVTLIQLFPELSSNDLVRTQMQIHVENSNTIRELRVRQVSFSRNRWWLHFNIFGS